MNLNFDNHAAIFSVKERLELETLRRGAHGAVTQILFLLLFLVMTPAFPGQNLYQTLIGVSVFIFALRWGVFHQLLADPRKFIGPYRWSLWLGASTTVLWSAIIGLAIWHFHLNHFIGLTHIFLANGLMAAVMYSLAATPWLQRFYILFMGTSVSLVILIREDENYRYTSLTLMMFAIYLTWASRKHSQDLKSTFQLEALLIKENNNLKEAQQELEIQRAKADFSARLAALGEMAGGVAHEINNPLAIISANASALEKKLIAQGWDSEIWRNHVEKIIKTVHRIAGIVKSLLSLSRDTSTDETPEELDLNKIIEETLDLCREKMRNHDIEISFQRKSHSPLLGFSGEIGQVLLNLLSNAYDASKNSPKGRIEIEISEIAGQVLVAIRDWGVGVSPAIQEKLFQPFFTTKQIGEGTGLGLSISRALMIRQGGGLTLEKTSLPTEFLVRLKRN